MAADGRQRSTAQAGAASAGSRWRRHWPLLRRLLLGGFVLAIAVLLWRFAANVDWPAVWRSARALPALVLAAALGVVAASYLTYSAFDLLGRQWVRHRIPARTTMAIAFVSYAFNQNFGTLVGGAGLRIRLYTQRGLDAVQVSRVIGLSLATNWLGYLLLVGVLAAAGAFTVPEGWGIAGRAVPLFGIAMLLVTGGYLLACALFHDRDWCIRGHRISLPGWRLAMLQLLLSSTNWMLMAGVMTVLLQGRVGYVEVLGVALCAAIAGAIAHIPAGLGVLEAVYVTLLGDRIAPSQLLAAALAYRLLYYIVPLAVAAIGYLLLERRARRSTPPAPHAMDQRC